MPWQNPGGQAVQRRLDAVIQDLGATSPRTASESGRFVLSPLDCSSTVPYTVEQYGAMQCIGAAVESLVEGATLANVVGMKKQSTADTTAQTGWYEPLASKIRTVQTIPKDASLVRKDSKGVSQPGCTSTCSLATPLCGPGGRLASWKTAAAEPHTQLCCLNNEEQAETTCKLEALAVLQNKASEGQCTIPRHCNSQCSSPLGNAWAVSPSCWYVLGRLCAWRCFLAAPLAAMGFAVIAGARRWGNWEQVEPGVQVMSLTSWLQCCWFVMSRDGRRITVRLAQLAAAGLGLLLVLMPLRPDIYGSQLQPGALDEQVDSGLMLPDLAALWSALAGAVVGGQGGAAADEQPKGGYESLQDAERRRSSTRLQAALAFLLAMWMLQVLAASLTPPPAAATQHHSPLLLGPLKSHADLASLYGEEAQTLDEGYLTLSLARGSGDPPMAPKSGWGGESVCCCCTASFTSPLPHLATGLQPGPVLQGPAQVAQWALLVGAVAAQCAVAVEVVEMRRPVLERLQLSSSAAISSIPMPTPLASSPVRIQLLTVASSAAACWPALGILALAMSAPLLLPSLLSAAAAAPTSFRARLLLHPALLQPRPATAAGRQLLGLHLADRNAARLLTALAVGVLLGPGAGAFTWQLLQVATVVVGMAALWLTGIRRRNSLLVAQQQHVGGGGGGYSSLGPATGSGMGMGADCTQQNGGIAGPCAGAGPAAAAAGASTRAVSFAEAPVTHGAGLCAASGRAACGSAAAAVGCGGPWRPSGREGDMTLLDGGSLRVAVPDGSGSDGPLTPPSCGLGSTGGGSFNGPTLLSPSSSGRIAGSGAATNGSTDPGAVYCGGGGGGISPACSNWSTAAHLARRPPPLAPVSDPLDLHYLALDSSHHHHRHATTADGFATQTPSPAFPPISPSRVRLPGGRTSSTPHSSCHVASRPALAHWQSCARTAVTPWNLLVGLLGTLTALLWLVLMAPPLTILGDGPANVFEGLMETAPGAVLVLALLAGAVCAGLLAAGCLVWCAATGELWRRGRSDAWEYRRLECLAWAGGLQVLVAAFSALSWALGEEHNIGAFMVAEALRMAALWPLVWLLESWLLMPDRGTIPVGGCMQHAGCGVTCCVLRWCGLRSSSPAVSGGRRDAVWDCEGQAAGRWSTGRRVTHGTNLRVEVN